MQTRPTITKLAIIFVSISAITLTACASKGDSKEEMMKKEEMMMKDEMMKKEEMMKKDEMMKKEEMEMKK